MNGNKYTSDYATIKYTPGGDTVWTRRFNGLADSDDVALDIAADTRGNVYVTGKSFGANFDYATIKYSKTTDIREEAGQGKKPYYFALLQNYPNPFNPSTTIPFQVKGRQWSAVSPSRATQEKEVNSSQFTVDSPVHTILKIYNILGQLVRTLVHEEKPPGSYNAIWDGKDEKGIQVASGIYFYRLSAGNFSETRRMVLIK